MDHGYPILLVGYDVSRVHGPFSFRLLEKRGRQPFSHLRPAAFPFDVPGNEAGFVDFHLALKRR